MNDYFAYVNAHTALKMHGQPVPPRLYFAENDPGAAEYHDISPSEHHDHGGES